MPSSITLTVSHLPTSTSFFLSALQPLNYVFRGRQEHTIGFGPASPPNTPADFWITQEIPGVPAGAAHVAFPAASRAQVQDFFLAALKAGGKIHGEPCQRDASGYYSAAVIDFDGNSIEAVYRPAFGDDANKENADARSMVSHRSARAPSAAAPPKSVVSAAKSVRAPSQVASQAPSYVSSPPNVPPENTQPRPKPSGDVLGSLINEARNAANVARDLVNSMTPNLISSAPPNSSAGNNSTGGGSGAGEAIVGTLLGVAAGAALHYAFSNRSKEDSRDDREEHKFVPPPRPSGTGRSVTEPVNVMRAEYSTVPSEFHGVPGGLGYRAIEPAPSEYTYAPQEPSEQKLITMYDHDPSASTVQNFPDQASTIRPASVTRRVSMDSGVGLGVVPRDFDALSHASSKASRQSKKSMNAPPPTSYRAPTALTVKSKVSVASGGGRSRSRASSLSRLGRSLSGRSSADQPRSRSQSRHTSRSRRSRRDEFEENVPEDEEARTVVHMTESVHRSSSHVSSHHSHTESKVASHVSAHHSQAGSRAPSHISVHQSQAGSKAPSHVSVRESQAGSKAPSHISMHESQAGSKAPSHVSAHESHAASKAPSHASAHRSQAGSKAASHTSAHQSQAGSRAASYVSGHDSQATIKPASRVSSKHSRRDPAEYPLPPSRAATWAGSDIGRSSFVSARSNLGPTGPRTIIGKLNPVRDGGEITDDDDKTETASMVSKQKELAKLDVTDREVRPEDSVSQISVESRRSRRSKASSRR
ncbi:uncharacterized protein PV07_11761 [Cladophialophora immunda]|uniref:VOC domain-containing protein n=1 Tax=Cladophialophora immunda TaxID=569365 RepID=A0A0D2BWX5_9EURO|nr:uncharacterized protein PV07_11761 [Cladophialophora immunda]KIW23573.1 hypothetical protein PV07_11761 [Cladophialophora immunda]OQV09239.1 hypothetical protein CLAIMM_13380 [Cladophialophora immunda]